MYLLLAASEHIDKQTFGGIIFSLFISYVILHEIDEVGVGGPLGITDLAMCILRTAVYIGMIWVLGG